MPERTNFEVINRGQITPHRLHALMRLVPRRRQSSREEVLTLLQPSSLSKNTDAAAAVFAGAVRLGLISHDSSKDIVTLSDDISRNAIETREGFRSLMQARLCGICDPDEDNYLLNEMVAWYAVQTPDVYSLRKQELTYRFNQELYPQEVDDESEYGRAMNDTKLNAWNTWTAYLGWGFMAGNTLWPVAHERLQPKLVQLDKQKLHMSDFMSFIAETCPEMDGGQLFERCWISSRPGQARGQQLSFMLSTTLGTLHGLGYIRLIRSTDAINRWQIYPSTFYPYTDVTDVEVLEK